MSEQVGSAFGEDEISPVEQAGSDKEAATTSVGPDWRTYPPCPKCKSNGNVIDVFGRCWRCLSCCYVWPGAPELGPQVFLSFLCSLDCTCNCNVHI